jgi:thiol-disulfide isomerase/thioredoxin
LKAAGSSAELARKRLALVGQPFVVEGMTLDGKPFDWSAYAGKVVLLDFWATWCGPCIEELPNIRRNFEQFHSKGFDVVGINVDHEINRVKQFLSFQELPWVTVTSQDALDGKASEDFSQHPMPAKCGIDAIPFVALIGKDGKVDSIHVRGPRLEARLTELLGPPATAEVPADPTQPGAGGARPASGAPPGNPPAGGEPALRPGTGDRGSLNRLPTTASPVGLLVAQLLVGAAPAPDVAGEPAINPYRAKAGLKTDELAAYIEKMLDKPQSIQHRDGFAAGLVEACDRILAADPPAKAGELLLAAETKLALLHREACEGKTAADEQLSAFVAKLKDDPRPRIAREVAFFRLEQKVRSAGDLPLAEIPALLAEVQEFATKEKLTAKHLRLASSTVAAINRLESGDEREQHFAAFGGLFAKSSEPELARYGKQLARGGAKGIDPAAAVAVPR